MQRCRTNICSFVLLFSVSALLVAISGVAQAEPLRIDFGIDSGRSNTGTQGWQEWQVPKGEEASREFNGIQLSMRPGGENQQLEGQWKKAGFATGATLATDAVTVTGSEQPSLELEIEGLKPGKHTLVTYHNSVNGSPVGEYSISVNERTKVESLSPSSQVASNEKVETAYLEFEVDEGEPVMVRITAKGSASPRVVLNGIAIDGANPKQQAKSPTPSNFDWHADADSGELRLSWQPADGAVKHHLYIASEEDLAAAVKRIDSATPLSNEYVGDFEDNEWEMNIPKSASLQHYAWRVDTEDELGNVTKGDVWRFRPRHLAFPEAEGYGRFAIGGRGGKILRVTNLNDSGPGSLRAAVEAEGPRIVVFDVGGRVVLEKGITVRNPYLTIAGQTAPGKGICLSNYNLGMFGSHDNIIRFIRVRPGDTSGDTLDGMGMASTDHSIIDHCSVSWSHDEAFSSRGAENITLQRTLISEALNVAGHDHYEQGKQHGYAASIGGDIGSFHHNLLAHCAGRNWSMAGGVDQAGVHAGRLDIRNNLVYNWSHRTTDGGAQQVNFVNNYYRPGPASDVFHVIKPQHEHPFGPQEYYVKGNVMEGHYDASQRYAGVAESRNKPMEEYIVEQPFFESHVNTTSAEEVVEDVLSDVGCNRPVLDEHDKRVIQEVRNKTTTYKGSVTGLPGLPDSQEDVGGWEEYPEVRRDADWDSDGDGLPNWWEEREGLDPNSPSGDFSETHDDKDGDGYTNIEEYLHHMATEGYDSK